MAKLHLCGNIIPQIWHKTIVSEKTGKADLIAINILADIAYWYRPAEERDELTGETVGYHPKFAADILQRSYDDLAEHFGISKGQAKCAVIRLEQLGVVRRVFRKISVGGISIPNVLFLALNVDRLRELTYRKAGYSKKFREEHEEEILLHQAAKNAFDEMGVKKLPKVKELQTEYAKLLEEKKKTYAEYRRSREEMRELLTAKANVDRVLKMEVEQDVEKEKDHGQR